MNITNSSVYVCNKRSYGQGRSLELICYGDAGSFREACCCLFAENEEFIYFDYEDIPDVYITERWISPNYFPLVRAVAGLEGNKQEAFSAWLDRYKPDLEEQAVADIVALFDFSYAGSYRDPLLFAREYAREQLNITSRNSPSFDFDSYKDILFRDLFLFVKGGYVFRKIPVY